MKTVNLPAKELPIKPLTLGEVQEAAQKRVSLITKEFSEGFDFIKDYGKSVTFFGGSRVASNSAYYKQTQSLAKKIVETLGYSVFTGGGPGIMEAANRGAYEAGGSSLGLTIHLPHEQVTNPYLTDHVAFYYFFSRKVCMSFSAEAYVFCPGGFGTFDEFFEILTLVQTRKIEKVPIILLGKKFWDKVDTFIKEEMLSQDFIEAEDMNLYTITDNEEEIIEIIRKVPIRNGVAYKYGESK